MGRNRSVAHRTSRTTRTTPSGAQNGATATAAAAATAVAAAVAATPQPVATQMYSAPIGPREKFNRIDDAEFVREQRRMGQTGHEGDGYVATSKSYIINSYLRIADKYNDQDSAGHLYALVGRRWGRRWRAG